MAAVSPALDAGTILAERFVVQSSIAPGLYRAFDRTLGRLVAVQLCDPQVVREHREAIRQAVRAARMVLHPNVVLFHEFHEESPPFYAIELLYGETLEARLRRVGHLEAAEISTLVESLAGALAAIHDAGVAHGQLRSRDIVIRSDGSAVIALPALARVASPLGDEVRQGEQAYVAPETRGGDEPTPSADVYSLGAIGYHALYGQLPPLDPRLPDVSLSTTSLHMARVVGRCLDPAPSERPTARQIAADVRNVSPQLPISSSFDTDVSLVRRVVRQKTSPLAAAALGALALVAIAIAAVWIGKTRESSTRLSMSVGGVTIANEPGWAETAFRRLLRNALASDRRIAVRGNGQPDVGVEGSVEVKGEEAAALLHVRPAHGDGWDLRCSGRGLAGAAARCAEQLSQKLVANRTEPAPDDDERRDMKQAGITTVAGYQAYLQALRAVERSDWSAGLTVAFQKLGRLEADCPYGSDPVWIPLENQTPDQAMARVEKMAQALPPGPTQLFAEVDVAFWKRDVERVRQLARDVQEKAPNSVLVHEAMVNALLHLGLRTEARAFGEEALRRHPDWTPLWDEVLGLYEGDDLRTEMARRFDEAQPELTLAHLVHAKTLTSAGRAKEAVEEFRKAEMLAPDDTQVVEGRTALELQEGRHAEAERYARRLLTLGTDGEVQGYLWLGNQKALRGRFREALQMWQRGDEVSARRPDGWSQSAIVCAMSSRRNRLLTALELGDKTEARRAAESITAWVKLRPWNLGYQASGYMLGQVALWRAGQIERPALDQYIDKFAADSKHAVTPALLGMVRVIEAELARDSALGVQAARELADVGGPAEQYAAGMAFLDSGDLHAAEARLMEVAHKPFADTERAFKMMSPYHRVHALYRLGQVYERQKRGDQARQMYRRFVDAWEDADRAFPDIVDAKRKLGE